MSNHSAVWTWWSMKQTIFLYIRAKVSRKQNNSLDNHLELTATFFSWDIKNIAVHQACSYSRGRGREHPVKKRPLLATPPHPYPLPKKVLLLKLFTEVSLYYHLFECKLGIHYMVNFSSAFETNSLKIKQIKSIIWRRIQLGAQFGLGFSARSELRPWITTRL